MNHIKDNHTHTHTLPEFSLDIPIFSKLYDFYKNLNYCLTLFPKTKRFTLGQKLDQITIDIIEFTITAGYLPKEQKLPFLQKISIKIDLLKILIRLSCDIKCLDNNKYQSIASQLLEIGKMLGGWIKAVKE